MEKQTDRQTIKQTQPLLKTIPARLPSEWVFTVDVMTYLSVTIKLISISVIFSVGVPAKKLESWLDEQDDDLNELREELKKETKQHENTLRVTSS